MLNTTGTNIRVAKVAQIRPPITARPPADARAGEYLEVRRGRDAFRLRCLLDGRRSWRRLARPGPGASLFCPAVPAHCPSRCALRRSAGCGGLPMSLLVRLTRNLAGFFVDDAFLG